jgi:hypothetical protein
MALLLAHTSLHSFWLSALSFLACAAAFCGCGCCWYALIKCCPCKRFSDEDAGTACGGIWCALGLVAGVLCIVLSGVADKLVYLEVRRPVALGVEAATSLPGCGGAGGADCPREV